jgi:hypothetical protein
MLPLVPILSRHPAFVLHLAQSFVPLGRRCFKYLGAIVALELDLVVLAVNHFGSLINHKLGRR